MGLNFVERMIGRETPDFRFSSFSDWWDEVADVRTDSFDWWYVTGVSVFVVLYWLLFIVGVIQLACDSRRRIQAQEAEAENEQRNRRREMKTPKRRVRFSPVTEIQMLPLEEGHHSEDEEQTTLLDTTTIQMPRLAEEGDTDSEDEEATPLNTTVIQMSTLEEDQNSDEEQTLWA